MKVPTPSRDRRKIAHKRKSRDGFIIISALIAGLMAACLALLLIAIFRAIFG